MTITFVISFLITIFACLLFSDEIDSYFNKSSRQSAEKELAIITNRLYNECLGLNNDALNAYKALIQAASNPSQTSRQSSQHEIKRRRND